MKTLSDKISYHKNVANPPLDSLSVKDVKQFIKDLKEYFDEDWDFNHLLNCFQEGKESFGGFRATVLTKIDKLVGEDLI